MPELPEVEVVRRGLDTHVVNRRIEVTTLLGARVARRHLAGPVDLADRLRGNLVRAARRRGKYLWLVLEAPDGHLQALVIHLGMSGQLLVEPPDAPSEPHLHATFDFADDGLQLRFVDQRTFGGLALADLATGPTWPTLPTWPTSPQRGSPRSSGTSHRTPLSQPSTNLPSSRV